MGSLFNDCIEKKKNLTFFYFFYIIHTTMASAGITPNAEVQKNFDDVKSKKKDGVLKGCVFKMDNPKDPKECIPDGDVFEVSAASAEERWQEVIKKLPRDQARYMVVDFDFAKDGREISKLLFVNWVPEDADRISKMTYASTVGTLQNTFHGTTLIQGNDNDDISYATISAKLIALVK